jgi:NAD(P)-dependent dehydrogenase (short-subunit alcohol dehydrogenase family)
MDLHKKAVIVTGSGGVGSGRAMARRFAREGCDVVVSDINERGGRETVSMIEAEGGNASFCRADVSVESEVRGLIAFAETTYGGLDILINNASAPYEPQGPLTGWFDAIHADLLGAMYGTLHAIEAMRRRGGGSIVNIGSTSALGHGRKHSNSPGYDTAKAGVTRLTTTLGWLHERENIRVNCLVPDWVATPEVKTYYESLTPQQRKEQGVPQTLTTLDEIAGAVIQLVTDETLAGRVLIWWNDRPPQFIAMGDPGFASVHE